MDAKHLTLDHYDANHLTISDIQVLNQGIVFFHTDDGYSWIFRNGEFLGAVEYDRVSYTTLEFFDIPVTVVHIASGFEEFFEDWQCWEKLEDFQLALKDFI